MYLPDINIWLALAFDAHVHHARAKAWFDALTSEPCYFCRFTQQGFLRLATNPKAFGPDAVTMDGAWRLYDAFLQDPRIGYTDEPIGLEKHWRSYTAGQSYSPQVWSDAYLVAFAKAASWQPVTCDKSFTRYSGLNSLVLA
jgi:uncharacterized protein